MKDDNVGEWNCLSISEGLCGLGGWVQQRPNAVGNLAERDYSVDDVKEVMEMIGKKWPGVKLTIHCGGENESDTVVNTLELSDGKVKKLKPKMETLPGMSEELMEGRMKQAIYGNTVEKEMRRCSECYNDSDEYVSVEVTKGLTIKMTSTTKNQWNNSNKHKISFDFCKKCGVATQYNK